MAKHVSMALDQGATFSRTFDLTDDDGNTVDTTNLTATAQFRRYYESNTFVAFTCNFANSALTLSLTANQTANVVAGRYVYDVDITDSANNTVTRLIEGVLTVTPSVTR